MTGHNSKNPDSIQEFWKFQCNVMYWLYHTINCNSMIVLSLVHFQERKLCRAQTY